MSLNSKYSENINVFCRFRPINEIEKSFGTEEICQFTSDNTLTFHSSQENNFYSFKFNKIFPPSSSQECIYENGAKNIIDSVLSGYNGAIITYGLTGTGKTYTIEGKLDNEEKKGIIPRVINDIFNYIYNNEKIEFLLKVSIIEINDEKIKDLINNKINLNIKEDNYKGIYIENLTEYYVCTPQEILSLLEIGNNNRSKSYKDLDEYSTRSHFIFMLKIFQNNKKDESYKISKLLLVDLGGSDKIPKSQEERKSIEDENITNKSLNTLEKVINNLADGKNKHIPYKESKLTRILQESFGGNYKTNLILTCSPSIYNECQTLSNLRFGEKAKKIKNKPVINKELNFEQLKKKINDLNEIIHNKDLRIKQLEKYIILNKLKIPNNDSNDNNCNIDSKKHHEDNELCKKNINNNHIKKDLKDNKSLEEKINQILDLLEKNNNYLEIKINFREHIIHLKEIYMLDIKKLKTKIESLEEEISRNNEIKYKLQLALIEKQTNNIENSFSSKNENADQIMNIFSEFIQKIKNFQEISSNTNILKEISDFEIKIKKFENEKENDNDIIKNTITNNNFLEKSHFSEEFKETKIEKVEKYIQTDIIEEELAKLQEEYETDKKYLIHCLQDNKQIILELKNEIIDLQNKNKTLENNTSLNEKKIRDKNILLENNIRELKKKYEESQIKRMILENNYLKLNKILMDKKNNKNNNKGEIKENKMNSIPSNMIKIISGVQKEHKI